MTFVGARAVRFCALASLAGALAGGCGDDSPARQDGAVVTADATATSPDAGPAPDTTSHPDAATPDSGADSAPADANPDTAADVAPDVVPDLGRDVAPDLAPAGPAVKINEIESDQGTPGDWVELFNIGSAAADISGWVFKDGDDGHSHVIPAGTVIAPGGFYVLEESAFGFGLGGADSARLWTPGMASLVDSHAWTAHAGVTWGRCPDGTGAFVNTRSSTKGMANACGPADGGVAPEPWPGKNMAVDGDEVDQFTLNLSGLTYEAGATPVLWASLNNPGTIYPLLWNGTAWKSDTSGGWSAGKGLRFPDGSGNPDAESLTRAEAGQPFMYVASERNDDGGQSAVSRLSVLRYDLSAAGAQLTATHEWNLTADLPSVDANAGLEAITWIPDAFLVGKAFVDQSTTARYDPARYPNHGTGLFVVGLEANGQLYAYALDHSAGTFKRVATFPSGHSGIMGLEFDRDSGALWAACDNTCAGVQNVLGIVDGKFAVRRSFARPSTLPDSNHEGIGIAPDSECSGGFKKFFWADDSRLNGHALRIDSIPCGPLF